MGRLENGSWVTDSFVPKDGAFKRATTHFRHRIAADGDHPPQSGRYHLYVSYACPWAHRALIARALNGLEEHIGVSVVCPLMGDDGWTFATDFDGATGDRVNNHTLLRDVYTQADPTFTGRVTVPILWDTTRNNIVNNESSEIIRIFDEDFGALGDETLTQRPEALTDTIDDINERVYRDVNNGVYKCGFAGSQQAYDEAAEALFDALDWLESRLADHRYVAGDRLTEADIRLFTTLVRFDAVYAFHFRCNKRLLRDYRHLSGYLRELYTVPAFHDTTDMRHIRHHYYRSHASIHPTRIVPIGPVSALELAHDRARVGGVSPMQALKR